MRVLRSEELVQESPNGLLEYQRLREKYLELCRRYGLNPFDLDILSLGLSRLPREDKLKLVRYILKLTRLERRFKRLIPNGLFPLTVQESERSGYLVPAKRGG